MRFVYTLELDEHYWGGTRRVRRIASEGNNL
jgi:hypothetical protein